MPSERPGGDLATPPGAQARKTIAPSWSNCNLWVKVRSLHPLI